MSTLTRRDLLRTSAAAAAALALPTLSSAQARPSFAIPALPYALDALEPHIDAKTMEIHHGKHHQAYVDNLNKAVAGTEWASKTIEEILVSLDKVPEKSRTAVRNNGGGHYNHSLFWQMMSPKGGKPSEEVAAAITAAFKDMDGMKKQFKEAALTRFGSGWAWLVAKEGKLAILSQPNQDNPIMDGSGVAMLGLDVWEHAYYLKYQNKRADYVDAWWNVVNWEFVNERFAAFAK